MTGQEIATMVSITVALISIGTTIYLAAVKVARIEVKVDTMWDFQMRRAMSEAIQHGIGTMKSPLHISPEARQWMAELAEALRTFYTRLGRHLTDADLAVEIERRFGQEIMEKVCIPHGLFQGACLLIAIQVAKEGADAELILPEAEATRQAAESERQSAEEDRQLAEADRQTAEAERVMAEQARQQPGGADTKPPGTPA